MTTFRASAARARRGVRDRLPAKRRAVPANKKVEPRAALARLLLPLLILPATLGAQGDALRAPRPDVSLAGEPFLATTITKPLALDSTGTAIRVRASGLPEQGLGFRVREDLPAATFVAWLRSENIAPDSSSVVFLFTALPIVRDRAPAKAYLRVPQGIGPATFQGYAQAAGTLRGRRTIWAQGADEPAEAHAFAIGLDGADALPGPATIIPFQMCALWGALNSSIDPDQDTAPIHAWGKKMWRRALTDAQLRDIFQTDLAALKAKGLAGGKATNRKSRIVNRESAHPKPLAVPRAPARPNLPKSAQSAFSPVVPSAAADP